MQEEVNQKTVSLIITTGKLSLASVKAAMIYFVREMEKANQQKASGKSKTTEPPHGKQSHDALSKQGTKLTNIEKTDKNIGSFNKIARKYSIDYALKKDKSASPPVYYVFFRAKDVNVMEAAFKEFTNMEAKNQARPSVRQKLAKAIEALRADLVNQKVRNKHKEQSR